MKNLSSRLGVVAAAMVLVGAVTVVASATGAHTASGSKTISACVQAGTKTLDNVVINKRAACSSGESRITWNATGRRGASGRPGTNGTSIVTSAAAPSGACTTGNSDVDLANGEVFGCESSTWSVSGSSIMGPSGAQGATGPAGANVAAGQSCSAGEYVTGFDASGNITCAVLPSLVATVATSGCGAGESCFNVVGYGLAPNSAVNLYVGNAGTTTGNIGTGAASASGTFSANGIALSCVDYDSLSTVGTTASGVTIQSNIATYVC
jgi:hypothetical protein